MSPSTSTHSSLLERVRDPRDEEAWCEFVATYTPQIFAWARRHGLQNSDAGDVTQIVLGKLVRAMQSFQYDSTKGRFRSWLRTVTANAVRSFATSANRVDKGVGGTSVNQRLHGLANDDAVEDLFGLLDAQAERDLLTYAEERVKLRVKPEKWAAWELTMRGGRSPAEAAQELGLRPSDVYVARTRVTKMLREEVRRLGGGTENEGAVE